MRRVAHGVLTVVLGAGLLLVAAASPVAAAEFGPVNPALADGAAGSLRDIVENDAVNQGSAGPGCVPFDATCGDSVVLVSGATYTLTCDGGGALAHGNTPLRLTTTDALAPAIVEQTCPGARTLDQAGDEMVGLVNVLLVGPGGGLMTPACTTESPTASRTWSSTRSQHVTLVPLAPVSVEVTRVLGALVDGNGQRVVFEATSSGAVGSPEFDAMVEQAQAAVGADATFVVGPELVDAHVDTAVVEADAWNGVTFEITRQLSFGPATILVGLDQSELYFFPGPSCQNRNDHSHTSSFVQRTTQAVTTTTYTYVVVGSTRAVAFTG